MLDMVFNIIQCKICEKKLKDPVYLLCDESICKVHEVDFKGQNESKLTPCFSCKKIHKLEENESFPLSKALVALF
jgi:hypothetical protein